MFLFTLWDARGRRLPLLIVLVLVLGGYVAVDAVARPAPVAHAAGVVPLAKVFLKSTRDAKKACKDAEVFWQGAWHCEGWWGGSCQRRSLAQPNYVWCGRPRKPVGDLGHFQNFFMSGGLGRQHMDVWRSALYYAGRNGTSAIRAVRGTTKWTMRITGAGPPS
jgi:hypothetical protein